MAFLFINLCEKYLLRNLRLKIPSNKLLDDQIILGQKSYFSLNPYIADNPSLNGYNKIGNKVIHSRLRLILIFHALIEFRKHQALNINVLYFILAKFCIEKAKKYNLLDDIQLVVKGIIRNYKYLKSKNCLNKLF